MAVENPATEDTLTDLKEALPGADRRGHRGR